MPSRSPIPLVVRPGEDCVLSFHAGTDPAARWIYWIRRRTTDGWTTSFVHVANIEHFIPSEQHRLSILQVTNYLRIWLEDAWLDPSWTDLYLSKEGDVVGHATHNRSRSVQDRSWPSSTAVHVDIMNLGIVADTKNGSEFPTMFAGKEATARILPFDDRIEALGNELRVLKIVGGHASRPLIPKVLAYIYDRIEDNLVGFIYHIEAKAATAQDLEACNNALTELHACGILHGNLTGNVIMSADGPLFVDWTAAKFRATDSQDGVPHEQWGELAAAEQKQLSSLDVFFNKFHKTGPLGNILQSRPVSVTAPKVSHTPSSDIWSVPINEIPITRRAQLRQRTQAFCDAFCDLPSNPPETMLDVHFSSDPKITEHGPRSGHGEGQHPNLNLPFLGRTFIGREDCLEYFHLLADTLDFEPEKDTFPGSEGYVIDSEAVGPDEGPPQPGFGGKGVVCVVGQGRFKSIGTGTSWEEHFMYRLSGFDECGRIGHWEIWYELLFSVSR